MDPNGPQHLAVFFCTGFLVLVDLLVYGFILPLIGVRLTGVFTIVFGLAPLTELMLVIATVFALIFGTFYANVEARFWRHLFAQDQSYKWVLQVRDLVNVVMIVGNFTLLYKAVRDMISDKEMKEEFLGQGSSYYILSNLADWGLPISESLLQSYRHRQDTVSSMFNNNSTRDSQYVHGAEFVLAIAGLTASITKLVYFNTLYTYLRAMDVFVTMQDQEDSSEDEDDETVSDYISDFSMPLTEAPTMTDRGLIPNAQNKRFNFKRNVLQNIREETL